MHGLLWCLIGVSLSEFVGILGESFDAKALLLAFAIWVPFGVIHGFLSWREKESAYRADDARPGPDPSQRQGGT